MPERGAHHILLVMTEPLRQVLADLEREAGADAAAAFSRLVVEYLADTRTGDGRVSTALGPSDLAARFAQPLPEEGRPLADVLARAEARRPARLQPPHAPAIDGAPGVGAAARRRLDRGADRGPQPVRRRSGRCRRSAPSSKPRSCGGCATWPASAPSAGGTFTSGGTEATFAGLLAARQAAVPDAWRGVSERTRPVVVCGEHAHYGVARAIGELGLGTDNAVIVPSRDFRMDVRGADGARWTTCGPGAAGDGGGGHGGHDAHRVVRRPRRHRAHLRRPRAVAARRRRARRVRPAVAAHRHRRGGHPPGAARLRGTRTR